MNVSIYSREAIESIIAGSEFLANTNDIENPNELMEEDQHGGIWCL